MAVLRPRNRVVYFRLSEEEYNRCLKSCEAGEAHNLSDLARTALQRWLAGGIQPPADHWQHRLHCIEQQLETITASLNHLLTAAGETRSRVRNAKRSTRPAHTLGAESQSG